MRLDLILLRQAATLPLRWSLSSPVGNTLSASERTHSCSQAPPAVVRALTSSSSSSLLRSRTETLADYIHHFFLLAFLRTKGIPVWTASGLGLAGIFISSSNSNLALPSNQTCFESTTLNFLSNFLFRFPSKV